jgi:hypothetical protein
MALPVVVRDVKSVELQKQWGDFRWKPSFGKLHGIRPQLSLSSTFEGSNELRVPGLRPGHQFYAGQLELMRDRYGALQTTEFPRATNAVCPTTRSLEKIPRNHLPQSIPQWLSCFGFFRYHNSAIAGPGPNTK